jgi:hypothetical protein
MMELERLGVRVVSGRLGRKSDEGEDTPSGGKKEIVHNPGMAQLGGSPPPDRSGSIGWGPDGDINSLLAGSRRPSMGLSMMNDGRRGSLGSLGGVVGLDSDLGRGGSLGAAFDLGDAQRRASSLGLGSLGGAGLGNMGMSVNPNQ